MPKPLKKKQISRADHIPGSRDVSIISKQRSWALYGRSGSGKTTLACSFPGPILLLDIRDEGTDSVSDIEDVRVKEIEDLEELEEAFYWLKDNPGKYRTIVIDTVTQWQQLKVIDVCGSRAKKGKQAGDWGSMTQQDWGKVSSYLKEWIVNFRDLTKEGYNVVFIAQDRVFNLGDDDDDRDSQIAPEVGPALSPAIAKCLNAAVSVIGNTFIRAREVKKEVGGKKKVKDVIDYCLRVGPNPVYVTKIRKPKDVEAPDFIVNPTYEDLLDVIKGK